SALDDDLGSDLGQGEELLGEGLGKADAAVTRRISRVRARVEGDALGVVHLHERHRRIVIFARIAELLLAEDLPETERSFLALLAGRSGGDSHELVAAIDIEKLGQAIDDDL